MKNKLALYSALLLTVGGTLVEGISGYATEANQDQTTATVKFVAGDDSTNPLDPNTPDNEEDRDNPTDKEDAENRGTGETGPLTIDYISNVEFGEQKIAGTQKVYNARNIKPRIQVTDNRGTGEGWAITAAATPFTGKDVNNQEVILKGAQLSFKNGNTKTQTFNTSKAPVASDITFNNTDAQLILNATKETGQGTWLDVFENAADDITLSVPGGVAQNGVTYQARINWTISDAPQA